MGRVVCDIETVTFDMLWTTAFTNDVLPAPEGADTINKFAIEVMLNITFILYFVFVLGFARVAL
ncbi:MAG: hypothetical protein Tsb005_14620 [Gammaproteobacteria bacterium]